MTRNLQPASIQPHGVQSSDPVARARKVVKNSINSSALPTAEELNSLSDARQAMATFWTEQYWPVFPTGGQDGKFPTVKEWQKTAVGQYTIQPSHNFAVRSGDGRMILDIDGGTLYSDFCAAFPALAETRTEQTPGGGFHLFWHCPDPPKTTTWHAPDREHQGLELMTGPAGRVVAAPSVNPATGGHWTIYKALPIPTLSAEEAQAVAAWIEGHETAEQSARRAAKEAAWEAHHLAAATGDQRLNQQLITAVVNELLARRFKRWSGGLYGLSPMRAEHKESFSFSPVRGTGWDFALNESYLLKDICPALGIDPATYGGIYERRPKRSVQAKQRKQAGCKAQTPAPKAASLPVLPADQVVNVRYLTADMLGNHRALAVASDVDTGKTTAVIELARRCHGRVIYLTHREKLAANFADAAERRGVIFELYTELKREDLNRVNRLAICLNTYAALDELPKADLLIIDEASQVLSHVYETAGTFEARTGEALTAGEALEWAARNAGRLIVMDAHLDGEPLDYARRIRPDLYVLRNDYHADRGALTLYESKDDAIDAGVALVKADQGPVVFACAAAGDGAEKPGKGSAAQLAEELALILDNPDDILLLTANNSGGERQREFLKDPNGQMGRYRAILHSPVIGTGFDITAPVRAVATIGSGQLTAYDHRQMAGRCRNASELHIYLPTRSTPLEENPAEIFAAEMDKTAMTGRRITAAGQSVPAVDERQRHYLDIHSQMMSRRNRSMNAQRGHFLALSPGYTVKWQPKSQAANEHRKELAAAAEKHLKELALTVTPIDRAAFKRLQDQGKVTKEARAGHVRGEIEHTIGLTINPDLIARLWTDRQRAALKALTDLRDDYAELLAFDRGQAANGVPLPKRTHRAVKREVRAAFLKALLTSDGAPLGMGKDEFETTFRPIINQYADELKRHFGYRPDRCKSAAATVRHVLAGMGLALTSEQHGKKRSRHYMLDKDTWQSMRQLSRQRLEALQAERAEEPGYSKVPFEGVKSVEGSFKYPSKTLPPADPTPDTSWRDAALDALGAPPARRKVTANAVAG